MDDEAHDAPPAADRRSVTSRLLLLGIVLVLVVLWWAMRPRQDAAWAGDPSMEGADVDDIIVDLRDDASPALVAAIERETGLDLVLISDQADDEQVYRAHVDPARRDAVLAALSRRAGVEIAEPDATYQLSDPTAFAAEAVGPHTPGFPNDPLYKHQWHMQQIKMPAAWKLADGGGITVAVLDTGVGYEDFANFHLLPDLAGISFVDGYDFVDNDAHANDDHGHGSHVTGTIAQVTNNGVGVTGIARNVKIMPLKVLSGSGSGSVAGIADAIRYAADHGAKVINMSLGGPFPSRVLKKAVQYAHDKGVVVVCAAGNDGKGKVGYPAGYPGAFAVAATQFDETTTFYSNWGKDVDIAAPGGNTRVDQNGDGMPDGVLQNTIAIGDPTQDDYFGYMGTSMAAPHVAGVAALVVGEGVTDPKMVEQILSETARQPATGRYERDRYGAGIIDAEAAVLRARSSAGGWSLLLGVLLAGAVASSARRRGLAVALRGVSAAGYLGGVLLGASGLFFLPYLAPAAASWPVVETLTRGLPSWDLALGPLAHGHALFFSALIPLGLLALGYGVPRARPALAGVAVGVAAHLLFHLVVPMAPLRYVPSMFGLGAIWLAVNSLICLVLANLALRK
jgi:serine protease